MLRLKHRSFLLLNLLIIFYSSSVFSETFKPTTEEKILENSKNNLNEQHSWMIPIQSAEDAFEVRKKMVLEAKTEILASYFALTEGKKALQFIPLIKVALKKGIKVKIILDHMNSKIPQEWSEFLRETGLEVKYFNPVHWRKGYKNTHRTHQKFIVVDGELLLVGGRNLRDPYFMGSLEERETFYDYDALFYGVGAKEAQQYFLDEWEHSKWLEYSKNISVTLKSDPSQIKREQKGGNPFSAELVTAENEFEADLKSKPLFSFEGKKIPLDGFHFYANLPLKDEKGEKIEDLYVNEIDHSNESIVFQNPYFILTPKLKKALRRAIKERGVRVSVLTNSLESNDLMIAQSAYLNGRRQLLNFGVEILEFQNQQTMHAKNAIFDGKKVIIGSYNLDPRSSRLNAENIVIVENVEVAQTVLSFYEETKKFCHQVVHPRDHNRSLDFNVKLKNFFLRYTVALLLRSQL